MADDREDFRALMKRVRQGCAEAVTQVLETYGQNVLRVVRRRLSKRLRSTYDSRDFTQDVWTAFFGREIATREFASPDELLAYLITLARNKLADAHRQRMRDGHFDASLEKSLDGSAAAEAVKLADVQPTPSQVAMAKEKWDELKNRVDRPARRILELLRKGLTPAEVAQKLGVNERTVRRVVGRLERQLPPSGPKPRAS
jgi:RNA polymerase sigma factor (sigma-70 family)